MLLQTQYHNNRFRFFMRKDLRSVWFHKNLCKINPIALQKKKKTTVPKTKHKKKVPSWFRKSKNENTKLKTAVGCFLFFNFLHFWLIMSTTLKFTMIYKSFFFPISKYRWLLIHKQNHFVVCNYSYERVEKTIAEKQKRANVTTVIIQSEIILVIFHLIQFSRILEKPP